MQDKPCMQAGACMVGLVFQAISAPWTANNCGENNNRDNGKIFASFHRLSGLKHDFQSYFG